MSARWTTREIDTSAGRARVHRSRRRNGSAGPWLVLGHGAGGGIGAADLQAVSASVAAAGLGLVLVEQPWRVANRRIAPRPAVLDAAWIDVLVALRLPGGFVVGGRSAGARVAARTAAQAGAIGVVALAFPLHPPGRPERSRADELRAVTVPLLVVQDSRDAFGTAEEIREAAPEAEVLEAAGGDHGLSTTDLRIVGDHVVGFLHLVGE